MPSACGMCSLLQLGHAQCAWCHGQRQRAGRCVGYRRLWVVALVRPGQAAAAPRPVAFRAVLRCGLTGGIGSGKSTVAAALAALGAVIIDADLVARQVVEPGAPAYAPLVARFGPGVLLPDGRLDRPALAAIVFSDPVARADLEELTHPAIGALLLELAAAAEMRGDRSEGASDAVGGRADGSGPVTVFDIALLDEGGRALYGLDVVVVVDAPVEVAVRRLVEHRGFTEADARARVAVQMSRERRCALADRIIDNSGDRDALDREVDELWAWLRAESARKAGPVDAGRSGSRPTRGRGHTGPVA